jgi:multiple sugar transport system substrate-binding protein
MKKMFYVLSLLIVASMLLSACGSAPAGPVEIRWYVGLGTGANNEQVPVEQEVVDAFNASHPNIKLVMEVVTNEAARDTLATQIAAGNGPDVIGPVGWGGSNSFYGQWLDMGPYIKETGFDTSIFDPALVEFYQTEEGQIGLPFAVFPAGVYFRPDMFDEAGLAYPPQKYGEKYVLDGKEVEWNWDTLSEVAKRLTVDINGNNSTSADFDRAQIVQTGFQFQWQTDLYYIPTYISGAGKVYSGEKKGEYKATPPAAWKDALQWYYNSMWGEQPFTATGPLQAAPEFGNGNVFNNGKTAMAISPTWYTCCMGDFVKAGYEFQIGILPTGADGKPHGRVDADTFRIWKGTKHPKEAFEVVAYLITTGGDTLLPLYGGMPAIASKMQPFFDKKTEQYPFVTQASWDVMIAGLSYPDTPSAEQFQPNWNEAWTRQKAFGDLLTNTAPDQLDFAAEWQKLLDDITLIYNK